MDTHDPALTSDDASTADLEDLIATLMVKAAILSAMIAAELQADDGAVSSPYPLAV